jgi:hypothetical protein
MPIFQLKIIYHHIYIYIYLYYFFYIYLNIVDNMFEIIGNFYIISIIDCHQLIIYFYKLSVMYHIRKGLHIIKFNF